MTVLTGKRAGVIRTSRAGVGPTRMWTGLTIDPATTIAPVRYSMSLTYVGDLVVVHQRPGADEDGQREDHAAREDPGEALVVELQVHEVADDHDELDGRTARSGSAPGRLEQASM